MSIFRWGKSSRPVIRSLKCIIMHLPDHFCSAPPADIANHTCTRVSAFGQTVIRCSCPRYAQPITAFLPNVRGSRCTRFDFDFQVYMADSEGYGIVIWNGRAFWRVSSEAFEPDPQATIFRVAGSRTIQNSHGVIGMAVTMEPSPLDRHMYFRPLSSYHMYDVKIVDLHRYRKNRTRLSYTKEPIELPSQSITHTLANQRVLFFSSIKDSSILCWNRKKEFTSENVVSRNFVITKLFLIYETFNRVS